MSQPSPYSDKRSEFFQTFFEKALPYDAYVKTGEPSHQERWRAMEPNIKLSATDQKILAGFKRKLNVLVMSGTWCGDCVRQGPMLNAIENATGGLMQFRYIDNNENPELQDELRINGAKKVPVIVALTEDFYELERFGDRHLSVYRRKLVSELGAACDPGLLPPAGDELAVEISEWVQFFERVQIMLRLAPMLRKRYGD